MEQKDSSLIQNRQIRIFISSTFQDLQEERDYLIKNIFPVLKEEAAKRDVSIIPLDLRWGITEQESKTGKVIEICLHEIENTYPFFIGIIGRRYGWCPKEDDVKNLTSQYPWLQEDVANGLSVTEIEMQYGVLRNARKLNAFFFVKDGEDRDLEEKGKLGKLINSIKSNGRYPINSYHTTKELGAQVEKYFIELIDKLFPIQEVDNTDEYAIAQHLLFNRLTQFYIPDIKGFSTLDKFLHNDDRTIVVSGPEGSGKSALISNWIANNGNLKGTSYLYHSIGTGSAGNNVNSIIKRLSTFVDEERKGGNDNPLIIIDGIWKDLGEEGHRKLLSFIFNENTLPKVIICHPDWKDFSDLSEVYHIPSYHEEEYWHNYIISYLNIFRKKLSVEQIDRILTNLSIRNHSIMRMFLDEIISFGSFIDLDQQIDKLLSFSGPETFYRNLITAIEEQHGVEAVKMTLTSLALSNGGLTEDTVIRIANLSKLAWSQLYCNLKNLGLPATRFLHVPHGPLYDVIHIYYGLTDPGMRRYETMTCLPIRNKIIETLKEEKDFHSFCEIGSQLLASRQYDLLFDHCFIHAEKYDIEEDQFLAFVAWILDPENKRVAKEYLPLVKILENFLSRFLDDIETKPNEWKNIYPWLSLPGIYWDKIKEIVQADSTVPSILLDLSNRALTCLYVLKSKFPHDKELNDIICKSLQSVIDCIAKLGSKDRLLEVITILASHNGSVSTCLDALAEKHLDLNEYDKAIKLCLSYGELNKAANFCSIASKYAFSHNDYFLAENYLLQSLRILCDKKPVEDKTRHQIAKEYEDLGNLYQNSGKNADGLLAFHNALDIYLELSMNSEEYYLDFIRVKYRIFHFDNLLQAQENDMLEWYSNQIEGEGPVEQCCYAQMCENGLTEDTDIPKAIEAYRMAAEGGNITAQRRLGNMYCYGDGVDKDFNEAIRWFSLAANQDDTESEFNLANILCFSDNNKAIDEGIRLYSHSAEKGYAKSQYMLGLIYAYGDLLTQSFEKAVFWLKKAADQGDTDAQYELGRLYLKGLGVEKNQKEAFRLISTSCENDKCCNEPGHLHLLGTMYANGLGCRQDYRAARSCFLQAAKLNDIESMVDLASLYANGLGGEHDLAFSSIWLKEAADHGNVSAQGKLAFQYANGLGVEQNYEKASMWIDRAIEGERKEKGRDHPKVLQLLNNQAMIYYLKGEDLPKALEIAMELTSHDSPKLPLSSRILYFNTLATICIAMGKNSEAIDAYSKCLQLSFEKYDAKDDRITDLEYKIKTLKDSLGN